MEKVLLTDLELYELDSDFSITEFKCGRDDINNFLSEDALNYREELLAKTYLFCNKDKKIIAYFSILTDCLNDKGRESAGIFEQLISKKMWNKLHRNTDIPNDKRRKQYPSVKIGRLGITEELHGTGLSSDLMDFIKGFVKENLRPACRFLILDAINEPKQIRYYEKNKFVFYMEDEDRNNRAMLFDLKNL